MTCVASIGERALIERVRARAGAPPDWVTVGIGDDAAVFRSERGADNVVTTDSLVDGVHFRRAWTSTRAIGRKALATNLSDLAAMGASPRAALLSLALPDDLLLDDFDALIEGFVAAGTETGTPLVGGNLTRTPGPLTVDTTAIGAVRPRKLLTRAGGRPGDELYVTGTVGAAATGLAMLTAGIDRAALSVTEAECISRYETPEARLRCGIIVARTRSARACVDLSDGLSDAALQLAAASGTGAVIEAACIPVHPGARSWWATRTSADLQTVAVSGGEDYELLFAVAPRRRRAFLAGLNRCRGLQVTLVGRLTTEPGAWLASADRRVPLHKGHDHFAPHG
jgi:thiamine-monophosphate kinase